MSVPEAYYAAVEAVASKVEQRPLPHGINEIEAGDWKLALNASGQPIEHDGGNIPPWSVLAQHKVYFVIALLDPGGGTIGGGMPEDQFIADMQAISGGVAA